MSASAFARELLETAVAVPSPSGAEGALVERLVAALEDRGIEARRDEAGNLIAERGRGPTSVLFLGHVDTVPGDIEVRVEDGRLFGRGAVDAKGPLCAALAALAEMEEATAERLAVRVVGAVGEEAPGSVGARHALATLPRPDLLVICEPSGWDAVTLGYKGHLRLELACDRPSGHAAGPEASAADRLVEALARLRAALAAEGEDDAEAVGTDDAAEAAGRSPAARAEPGGRAFDRLQVTILELTHRHDGLRERATATVGLRLPPAWSPGRATERIASLRLGPGVERRVVEAVPAVRGARDSRLARAFRVAIRSEGGRPRTVVKTGTSDWNVVAGGWPVPTLAYGPGDATLDHAPDEHLPLRDYARAVRVVGGVLRRLAETTPR